MSWGHPSDRKLIRWTKAGKGRRAERHALHCTLCERRLEALTELAPPLKAGLAAALTPSSAFEQRLQERLNQRLLNRETLAILIDLLDVGPETSRLLLDTHRDTPQDAPGDTRHNTHDDTEEKDDEDDG